MIHVIETLEALPEKTEELKKALLAIVPLSRQEKGCISYELFQVHETPDQFAVIMCWKDLKSFERHNSALFIQEFVENFEQILYHKVVETLYKKLD